MQFYSSQNGTPVTIVRLFYATELRYGIILDIAQWVWNREPIDLTMGYANRSGRGTPMPTWPAAFPCVKARRVSSISPVQRRFRSASWLSSLED